MNSSTSSDLAGELVSGVGSGGRTRQCRRIRPENSSLPETLPRFDHVKFESEILRNRGEERVVLDLIS